MCGIVGYLGKRALLPLLVQSLRQLEYRGYDSAGISWFDSQTSQLKTVKATGKLQNLANALPPELMQETDATHPTLQLGIGHIRWATHGTPTLDNAHPHHSQNGEIVLVHNGIIENFASIKEDLQGKGYVFRSETDTESIVHLLEETVKQSAENTPFIEILRQTKHQLTGAYALTVMYQGSPERLFATRQQAPLVVGIGLNNDEFWVASDVVALVAYTNRVLYLEDGQLVELSPEGLKLYDANGQEIAPRVETIVTGPLTIDKKGYKHFMLKEIYEQPDVVRNALSGRLSSVDAPIALQNDAPYRSQQHGDESPKTLEALVADVDRLVIIGCGTSYNAGLVAKYFIEQLVRVPVEVEAAGEYRYRQPVLTPNTLVVAISQSGETADTLEAIRQAKGFGARTIALTNRPDSSMAREVDAVIDVRAGVEVSVCATKSFVAQLVALQLLGIFMLERKTPANPAQLALLPALKQALLRIPVQMEALLSDVDAYHKLAKKYAAYPSFLFVARGINFPVAMEGALKLKEISYIHAEGYSGAELKHGPIALLDEKMPVLTLLAGGSVFDKMLSNCQEARAREAQVIALTNEPIPEGYADTFMDVITYPACDELLSPLLSAIPLQLLSYYIAEHLGKDVDQPRNLAKSVTVE